MWVGGAGGWPNPRATVRAWRGGVHGEWSTDARTGRRLTAMPKKKSGGRSEDSGPGAKAKAQKRAAQANRDAAKQRAQELADDAEWSKGADQRGLTRAQQRDEKAAALARKKALKKEAEEADQSMLASMKPSAKAKKAAKAKKPVTSALIRQIQAQAKAKRDAEAKKKQSNVVHADDVAQFHNRNKAEADDLSARSLEGALSVLDMAGTTLKKAPSFKAAFAPFSERETARIKGENPGLKKSQVQERVWKLWLKSPENPQNMDTLPYNAKKKA